MLKQIIFFISLTFLAGTAFSQNQPGGADQLQGLNVLVFTKTTGFYHDFQTECDKSIL